MKVFLILMVVAVVSGARADKVQSVELNGVSQSFYHFINSGQNRMMPLNDGMVSLQVRLDLLNKAKAGDRVALEYFIYRLDRSAKLLTQALIKASERGADVKILVDKGLTTFELNKFVAAELEKRGIETKYYNSLLPFPSHVSTLQFRNHRKLFLVKNEAIVGGRNIGDEYFGMHSEYNFDDRDVLVSGPIVDTIYDSFMEFWNNDLSRSPFAPAKPGFNANNRQGSRAQQRRFEWNQERAEQFITETNEDRQLLAEIESKTRNIIDNKKTYRCPVTTFVSDEPGATFFKRMRRDFRDEHKHVRKVLFEKANAARESVLIASPYFIQNRKTESLISNVINHGHRAKVEVFTNSLAATDHMIVSAALYNDLENILNQGVQLYLHSGDETQGNLTLDDVKDSAWGVHSKTMVFDAETPEQSEVFIGTYNVDNRSDFYNAEMGIFCKGNPEFTAEVEASIRQRMDTGFKVLDTKTAVDSDGNHMHPKGDVTRAKKRKLFLYYLPAWMLEFLL